MLLALTGFKQHILKTLAEVVSGRYHIFSASLVNGLVVCVFFFELYFWHRSGDHLVQ